MARAKILSIGVEIQRDSKLSHSISHGLSTDEGDAAFLIPMANAVNAMIRNRETDKKGCECGERPGY